MRRIKLILKRARALARLAGGLVAYSVKRATPPMAYQAMIQLFCASGGVSNDYLSRLVSMLRPKVELGAPEGILGALAPEELAAVTESIRVKGYHVFEQRLPAELCERLLNYGLTGECVIRKMDGESHGRVERTVYHRSRPQGICYDFNMEDLVNHPDIQGLLADPSVLAVAQEYLGCVPVADVVACWWQAHFAKGPDKEAAQLFHFDMDRIKWLKFFIYLTDVGPDNGPHTFVAGSQRTGGIPAALLAKGYARLTDDEVATYFKPEDFIEFVAPRGTIIAEDTRGLHKGKPVLSGDRLMLQIQFSNSLFGAIYPKYRIQQFLNARLAETNARFPRIYRNFTSKPKDATWRNSGDS